MGEKQPDLQNEAGIPVLAPDVPAPPFVSISYNRDVLHQDVGKPGAPAVAIWTPRWGPQELAFLANPSPKGMLTPLNAPEWTSTNSPEEAKGMSHAYYNVTGYYPSGRSGQASLLAQLRHRVAPQPGRTKVLSTLASVFVDFAARHTGGHLLTDSTAYTDFSGMDDFHKDEPKLVVNFASGVGPDLADPAHPALSSSSSAPTERALLRRGLVQSPANSFSIWCGKAAEPERTALTHSTAQAKPQVKTRWFFQGNRPEA